MKTHHPTLYALAAFVILLSSCQIDPVAPLIGGVPEMPYRPRPVTYRYDTPMQSADQPTAADTSAQYLTAPTTEEISQPPPPIPDPAPVSTYTPRDTTPAAALPPAAPPTSTYITPDPQVPSIKPLDMSSLSGAMAPTAPSTTPQQSTSATKTTDQASLPVAARVPGDPNRVWNPMDTSKKILIVDPKTGQPFPSGKKLKVRGRDGSDFYFIVP